MADAVLLQTATQTARTNTITLTGVTAGSSIIACLTQYAADLSRDYAIADDKNAGDYTQVIRYAPARAAYCFVKHNVAAGTTIITASQILGGASTAGWKVWEVAGLDYYASPITGNYVDAVNVSPHPCSAGITTTDHAFIVTASAFSSSSVGTYTAASGYSSDANGSLQAAYQWKDGNVPVSGDTATWNTTTARVATNVHVAFPAGVGVPPSDPNEFAASGWFGL